MKNQTKIANLSTLGLVILLFPLLLGCDKYDWLERDRDFDVENRIFRVVVNSDVKYDVKILEIYPDALTGDTTVNVRSSGTSDVNYGFTPKKNSRIVVSAFGPGAKTLTCNITFRGSRLGVDHIESSNQALKLNFEYVVKD